MVILHIEVYRARDTNLGRDVAIKVLPDAFARDTDRMARFGREAKLLAGVNHSNIAAIYGLETSGDSRALVMEPSNPRTSRSIGVLNTSQIRSADFIVMGRPDRLGRMQLL